MYQSTHESDKNTRVRDLVRRGLETLTVVKAARTGQRHTARP